MRGLILFVVSGADAKMHTWNAQRVFGQLSYNIVTSKSAQKDRAHPHKTGVRFEGAPWECSEEQPFGPSLLVRPESKLGVPHNAAEVKMEQLLQDYHEHIRTASDGRGNDTALSTDMILLHRIARGVRKHGSKSNTSRTITVETGLANGGSAVAIMSALGSGSLHIAIDPFQSQQYDGLALDSVRLFLGRMEAQTSHPTPQLIHLNESASSSLSALHRDHQCVDLFFMDDGHKFDDNMLELYHADKLLKMGGILAFHDIWMPSVKLAVSWALSNLGYRQVISDIFSNTVLAVLIKTTHVSRDWQHFKPFGIDGTNSTDPTLIHIAAQTVASPPREQQSPRHQETRGGGAMGPIVGSTAGSTSKRNTKQKSSI